MQHSTNTDRRDFLKKTIALGIAVPFSSSLVQAAYKKEPDTIEGEGFTFLFQGDSITDGNRSRNSDWNHVMGHGYQFIIASKWWFEYPAKGFHFFNRGISGNKVTDLQARWQKDTLEIKPDLLSILIGINDTATFVEGNTDFSAAQFEKGYRSLLQQTREQIPDIRLVLCEPFILPVGKIKEQWGIYSTEIKKRQDIVKQLSKEFNAVFVPFQSAFNKAVSDAPAEYWIWDGIHPMPAGHELMAREWLRQVSKQLKFIKG